MNITIKVPAGFTWAHDCQVTYEDGTPFELGISRATVTIDWTSRKPVAAVLECIGMGLDLGGIEGGIDADVRVTVHGKQYRLVEVAPSVPITAEQIARDIIGPMDVWDGNERSI